MNVVGNTDSSNNVGFSERIKDRHVRWWLEKEPNPFKQLGGKIQGRQFAEKRGCKVPELYQLVDRVEDIPDFNSLPQKFVLKPTRGWSANNVFLMEGGVNSLDGCHWTREEIVNQIKSDAAASQPGVKYLVEEYLTNWDGKAGTPLDYKFYMFGAEIAFIHIIERNSGTDSSKNRHWFLTGDWQLIEKRIVATQKPQKELPPKPDCLEELLTITQEMGRELNMFMRIDMYATTRGAVFGEFTPQPHGGNGFTKWADQWLGLLWQGKEGAGV